MSAPLRIVFLGSDVIALPLLEWFSTAGTAIGEIVAVFTQPDRPVGRGQKLTPSAIKRWAQARGIPVLQPEKLTPEVQGQLAGFRADLSLVMAYGHLLRDDFIATPRLGTLNLHTSILPCYRGASPIQTAIACGERQTGVSLMRIVRELDAGPVADVERVPIGKLDSAAELENRLAAACVPLIVRALPKLVSGSLVFVEQDHHAATFCRRLTKDDGALDFRVSARELAARINGLFPWPACSVMVAGQAVRIGLADAIDDEPADHDAYLASNHSPAPQIAGTVLRSDTQGVRIATGQGVLRFLRIQRPGGKMLAAVEFLRGFPISPGSVLPSRPMPPLVSAAPFPRRF